MSYRDCNVSDETIWICDECGDESRCSLNWEVNYKEGTDTCSMCVRDRIERHIKEARERKKRERKVADSLKSWLYDLI